MSCVLCVVMQRAQCQHVFTNDVHVHLQIDIFATDGLNVLDGILDCATLSMDEILCQLGWMKPYEEWSKPPAQYEFVLSRGLAKSSHNEVGCSKSQRWNAGRLSVFSSRPCVC